MLINLNKILMEQNKEGSGGGSSAPVTPSSPSVPSNEGGGSSPSFDFGALATYDDMGDANTSPPSGTEVPVVTAPAAQPAVTPAPVAPVAAAVPPTSVVAVPPVPSATPTEAPVASPVAAQPPAPTEAAAPLEQISFEKHRETFLPKLQELYKLTDTEAEQLRTAPEQALPVLAAKLHYEVQLATYNSLMSVMPQFFEVMTQQREIQSKANDAFYSKWDALRSHVAKDPKSEDVVRNCIKAFRNANPNADTDTIIANAGLLAMMTLKLPLTTPQVQGTPATPPVVREVPGKPPGIAAVGHVPANPAGGGTQGDSGNIFEDLANAYVAGDI